MKVKLIASPENYDAVADELKKLGIEINEKANLVEIIELPNLKHFIAGQFHPEFKSRPTRPHYSLISDWKKRRGNIQVENIGNLTHRKFRT